MSITYHERPGVYADYDASAVFSTSPATKTVAVAGLNSSTAGTCKFSSAASAAAVFGADAPLTALIRQAFLSGASTVLARAVPVDSVMGYHDSLEALLAQREATYFVIDSCDAAVQADMRELIEAASEAKNECIGLVGMDCASDEELIERSAVLNSPRMVLVAPQVYVGEEICSGNLAAAALAGLLAAQSDPAVPLNGAVLPGLSGVTNLWSETRLDALLRGGVTPLECIGGEVRVIRAVTTCTTINGVADATFRELNTILVIDEVLPALRTVLQQRFSRLKNTAVTRSAIRNQVVIELERRVAAQIIDSYDALTVTQNADDPTVCDIRFRFSVAHCLNRILLTAHISV